MYKQQFGSKGSSFRKRNHHRRSESPPWIYDQNDCFADIQTPLPRKKETVAARRRKHDREGQGCDNGPLSRAQCLRDTNNNNDKNRKNRPLSRRGLTSSEEEQQSKHFHNASPPAKRKRIVFELFAHDKTETASLYGDFDQRERLLFIDDTYSIPKKPTSAEKGLIAVVGKQRISSSSDKSTIKKYAAQVTQGLRLSQASVILSDDDARTCISAPSERKLDHKSQSNIHVDNDESTCDSQQSYDTQEDKSSPSRNTNKRQGGSPINSIPSERAVCGSQSDEDEDLCEVVRIEKEVLKQKAVDGQTSRSQAARELALQVPLPPRINSPLNAVERKPYKDSSPELRNEGVCRMVDDEDKLQRTLRIVMNDPVQNESKSTAELILNKCFSRPNSSLHFSKANGRKVRSKGNPINFTATAGSENSVRNFFGHSAQESTNSSDPIQEFEDQKTASPQISRKNEIRSSSRLRRGNHGADNPIEIDDSDDEVLLTPPSAQKKPRRRDRIRIDLVRVTVGLRSCNSECRLELGYDYMVVGYAFKNESTGEMEMTNHCICLDDVQEFHYFVSEVDQTILAMLSIDPTSLNGLSSVPGYWNLSDTSKGRHRAASKFMVFLFSASNNLYQMLEWMRGVSLLQPFLEDASIASFEQCEKYASIMLNCTRQDATKSPHLRRKKKDKSTENNEIWLVFPFDANAAEIDKAAECLNEAKHVIEHTAVNESAESEDMSDEESEGEHRRQLQKMEFGRVNGIRYGDTDSQALSSDPDEGIETKVDGWNNAETKNKKTRAHFLTIRKEDVNRLEQGEFLNDTLIDFWMEWLMRKEDRRSSPLHIFSSHFYTTLSEDGTDAVESWTARKNINVFNKHFIFLPINKSLHWSLCVVVNPASIVDNPRGQDTGLKPFPCILFLDSLKIHRKDVVANHVRRWLNAEWNRLMKPTHGVLDPFTKITMEVFSPQVPYQDNTWDCGVFVCRYAYALFMLRHNRITTSADSSLQEVLKAAITDRDEFQFDMDDIKRIRGEMMSLICRLATLYRKLKRDRKTQGKQLLIQSNSLDDIPSPDSSEDEGIFSRACSNNDAAVCSNENENRHHTDKDGDCHWSNEIKIKLENDE